MAVQIVSAPNHRRRNLTPRIGDMYYDDQGTLFMINDEGSHHRLTDGGVWYKLAGDPTCCVYILQPGEHVTFEVKSPDRC